MTDKEATDILTKHVEGLKANPCVIVDECLYEAFDMAIKALKYHQFKEDFINYMQNSHCGYDGDNPNRF